MTATICIHQKVEKTIEQMATRENDPKIAAQRAQTVIRALVSGVRITRAGLLSLRKDTRVKNLYKFNLGKGYRLITIKEKDTIYIMFIGTHDHCDRWLDSNRKRKPHLEAIPTISYRIASRQCSKIGKNNSLTGDGHQDSKSDILPEYSHETLRKIFSGLVSNS